MFTIADYLVLFPSVASKYDNNELEEIFNQVIVETNGYQGICDENARNLAIGLHVSHLAVLQATPQGGGASALSVPSNPNVKRLKSNNDEIEYFKASDNGASSFLSTSYGKRLMDLIDAHSSGFGGVFIPINESNPYAFW
jgi:hypothetical protein